MCAYISTHAPTHPPTQITIPGITIVDPATMPRHVAWSAPPPSRAAAGRHRALERRILTTAEHRAPAALAPLPSPPALRCGPPESPSPSGPCGVYVCPAPCTPHLHLHSAARTLAPSRVVEAIKRHSPRSTVVLVADLGAPSAASAAFTAGADRVLARGLEPAQVRPRCCCCLCNASLRSPPHRTHARACHAART